MVWPFRRGAGRDASEQPAPTAQRSERATGPVHRAPRSEWRGMAPAPLVVSEDVGVVQRRPASWLSAHRDPTTIRPLSHGLSASAPFGVIAAVPVPPAERERSAESTSEATGGQSLASGVVQRWNTPRRSDIEPVAPAPTVLRRANVLDVPFPPQTSSIIGARVPITPVPVPSIDAPPAPVADQTGEAVSVLGDRAEPVAPRAADVSVDEPEVMSRPMSDPGDHGDGHAGTRDSPADSKSVSSTSPLPAPVGRQHVDAPPYTPAAPSPTQGSPTLGLGPPLVAREAHHQGEDGGAHRSTPPAMPEVREPPGPATPASDGPAHPVGLPPATSAPRSETVGSAATERPTLGSDAPDGAGDSGRPVLGLGTPRLHGEGDEVVSRSVVSRPTQAPRPVARGAAVERPTLSQTPVGRREGPAGGDPRIVQRGSGSPLSPGVVQRTASPEPWSRPVDTAGPVERSADALEAETSRGLADPEGSVALLGERPITETGSTGSAPQSASEPYPSAFSPGTGAVEPMQRQGPGAAHASASPTPRVGTVRSPASGPVARRADSMSPGARPHLQRAERPDRGSPPTGPAPLLASPMASFDTMPAHRFEPAPTLADDDQVLAYPAAPDGPAAGSPLAVQTSSSAPSADIIGSTTVVSRAVADPGATSSLASGADPATEAGEGRAALDDEAVVERLYEQLRWRLRADLRTERERRAVLTDRNW